MVNIIISQTKLVILLLFALLDALLIWHVSRSLFFLCKLQFSQKQKCKQQNNVICYFIFLFFQKITYAFIITQPMFSLEISPKLTPPPPIILYKATYGIESTLIFSTLQDRKKGLKLSWYKNPSISRLDEMCRGLSVLLFY